MRQKKNWLLIGLLGLLFVGVVGCGSGASVSSTQVEESPIKLNYTAVEGTDNSFLLTWNPEYNRSWLNIRGNVRWLGNTFISTGLSSNESSYTLSIDVNTTYEVYVLTFANNFSENYQSNTIRLFIPIPSDYPQPVSLSFQSPTRADDKIKFNVTWSKSADPDIFDHYELWDISRRAIGYYDPEEIDHKILESNDINCLNKEVSIEECYLSYYDRYIVYVVSKSGKRTPSNWVRLRSDSL